MARKTIKVEIPTGEPAAFVKLTQDIVKHHDVPANVSPITDKVVKMAAYKLKSNEVAALRAEIEALDASLQKKMGRRDALLGIADGQNSRTEGTLYFGSIQIRDLLLAVNRGNEKALEPWGFEVSVGEAKSPTRKKTA